MIASKSGDGGELNALEKVQALIGKARMEYYKPIQVAEVLYRSRLGDPEISGADLDSYRIKSRGWRDEVTLRLYGKKSTSSARYQDDVWNEHAVPPWAVSELIDMNRNDASVEKYIYSAIGEEWKDFMVVRNLIDSVPSRDQINAIISGSWAASPSSTDRVVELLVLALLNAELRALDSTRSIEITDADPFSPLGPIIEAVKIAHLNFARLGHTNAADGGLDIWSNFGVVVSVKNRRLNRELFAQVIDETPVGDLLIVCREVGDDLDDIAGTVDRAISVLTLSTLIDRSETILETATQRENFAAELKHDFDREFPQARTFSEFMLERNYL